MKETLKDKPLVLQIGTAITVLFFVIGTTWNVARMSASMENGIVEINERIDHLSDKYVTARADITSLQAQEGEIKIKLATLEAILTRIEITQREILNEIK